MTPSQNFFVTDSRCRNALGLLPSGTLEVVNVGAAWPIHRVLERNLNRPEAQSSPPRPEGSQTGGIASRIRHVWHVHQRGIREGNQNTLEYREFENNQRGPSQIELDL